MPRSRRWTGVAIGIGGLLLLANAAFVAVVGALVAAFVLVVGPQDADAGGIALCTGPDCVPEATLTLLTCGGILVVTILAVVASVRPGPRAIGGIAVATLVTLLAAPGGNSSLGPIAVLAALGALAAGIGAWLRLERMLPARAEAALAATVRDAPSRLRRALADLREEIR